MLAFRAGSLVSRAKSGPSGPGRRARIPMQRESSATLALRRVPVLIARREEGLAATTLLLERRCPYKNRSANSVNQGVLEFAATPVAEHPRPFLWLKACARFQ